MALKMLRDEAGKLVGDQIHPVTVEEVQKWESRHVNAILMEMKPRILECAKDREEAIRLLEQPSSSETEAVRAQAEEALQAAADEIGVKDQQIADLTAERDALAARVLELEAPKS
jgi:hypothetical protein